MSKYSNYDLVEQQEREQKDDYWDLEDFVSMSQFEKENKKSSILEDITMWVVVATTIFILIRMLI